MTPLLFVIILIGCYLIGSISNARIITSFIAPQADLENIELRDPEKGVTMTLKTVGATTASMVVGPGKGWIIVLLDIMKSALPTLALRLLFPGTYYYFLGIAVMVGHIWPVYYRFHGGGGLATALGILLVVDPLGAFVSVLLAVIIGMFIIHETAICFLGGPRLFLVWISFRTGNWYLILFNLLINSLLIIAVLPDISTALKKGDIKISTGMDIVPLARPINAFLEKFRNKLKGDKETAENDNVRIGVKKTKE